MLLLPLELIQLIESFSIDIDTRLVLGMKPRKKDYIEEAVGKLHESIACKTQVIELGKELEKSCTSKVNIEFNSQYFPKKYHYLINFNNLSIKLNVISSTIIEMNVFKKHTIISTTYNTKNEIDYLYEEIEHLLYYNEEDENYWDEEEVSSIYNYSDYDEDDLYADHFMYDF